MSEFNRKQFLGVLLAGMVASSGYASDNAQVKKRKGAALPPPMQVKRPVDEVLGKFGDMVDAYSAASGLGPIIVEIDYIGNESSSDKLPNDLGQFARDALEKIGR